MAIDEKISGTITLIYLVAETGGVDEVWLAKPLSDTLDESAAKSERDNVFQPATLDGKPVGTVLIQTIPINYLTAPPTNCRRTREVRHLWPNCSDLPCFLPLNALE